MHWAAWLAAALSRAGACRSSRVHQLLRPHEPSVLPTLVHASDLIVRVDLVAVSNFGASPSYTGNKTRTKIVDFCVVEMYCCVWAISLFVAVSLLFT